MSRVVKKTQCPACLDTGQDNLAIYEDGTAFCFGCGHTVRNNDTGGGTVDHIKKFRIKDLTSRGLSERTCRKFDYGVALFDGTLGGRQISNESVHIAKYYTPTGEEVAAKIRTATKEFKCVGDIGKAGLFGQHLYEPDDRVFVTVCEGEIDAMSVAEAMGVNFPVVSVPCGSSGAKAALKAQIEWLNGFKHVVLCFDQDDAGQSAASECAELFPPRKVKVTALPLKDANEMLVSGEGPSLKSCVFGAKTYCPDTVLTIKDVLDRGLDRPVMGLAWPWKRLTDLTYGISLQQLYAIGAGTGVGKTSFIKDIMFKLVFDHKKKVGIVTLEQSLNTTLLKLAGSIDHKRLHVPGDSWNEKKIKDNLMKLQDRVYIYDDKGGKDVDVVLDKIDYMVRGLGCEYIFLDHLTALTADVIKEKVNVIDSLMSRLSTIVHELNCTIFAVSHLAKPPFGQSYEEGAKVTSSAFRGSQGISQWATFMIGIERNKTSEDPIERNVSTIRIVKDRFTGDAEGFSFNLFYDRDKDQMEETELSRGLDKIKEVF